MNNKYVVVKENSTVAKHFNSMTDAVDFANDMDRQELLTNNEYDGEWQVYELHTRGSWYVRLTLWLEQKLS